MGADNPLCAGLGIANLHSPGCDSHDKCYPALGQTQSGCDSKLYSDWLGACGSAYPVSSISLISSGTSEVYHGGVELLPDQFECAIEIGSFVIKGTNFAYSKASNGTIYLVKTSLVGSNFIKIKISNVGGNVVLDAISDGMSFANDEISTLTRGVVSTGNSVADGASYAWKFTKRLGCGFGALCKTSTTSASNCYDIFNDLKSIGTGVSRISGGVSWIPLDILRSACRAECDYGVSILYSIVSLAGENAYKSAQQETHAANAKAIQNDNEKILLRARSQVDEITSTKSGTELINALLALVAQEKKKYTASKLIPIISLLQ